MIFFCFLNCKNAIVRFLFFALVFFVGCKAPYQINEKEKLVSEIMAKSLFKIKKEKKLNPCGTGAQMMYEIKMLSLSFFCYEDISIEEGRDLLIYASNVLVDEVNKESRIKKYLYNDPFGPLDTDICIVLHNSDGSIRPPEKLQVISLSNGILKYKTRKSDSNLLNTIYKETYEEAVTKLKNVSDFSDNSSLLKREEIG